MTVDLSAMLLLTPTILENAIDKIKRASVCVRIQVAARRSLKEEENERTTKKNIIIIRNTQFLRPSIGPAGREREREREAKSYKRRGSSIREKQNKKIKMIKKLKVNEEIKNIKTLKTAQKLL